MSGRTVSDNPIIAEDIKTTAEALKPLAPRLEGRKILVTGAYGMLASYLVYVLLEMSREAEKAGRPGIEVTAVGRSEEKTRGRFGSLIDGPDLVPVYEDALTFAEEQLQKSDTAFDYIIHAASPTDPRSYMTAPEAVIRMNVAATDKLLQLAVIQGAEGFLFISSGEVYGRLEKEIITEEDGGVYEASDPRNVYALSKCLGERLVREAAVKSGLRAVIVRPSHTYGPTMDPKGDSRVFASFVNDAINGRDIVMTSDGRATRAFTYLTDAVSGYLRVLTEGRAGEAFNVTNNSGIRSIREIAAIVTEAAGRITGVERQAVFGDPDENYRENKNRQASIRSTEKLEALGWKAVVSPEKGFERTLRSFLD